MHLVARALAGDADALDALVVELRDPVQWGVGCCLRQRARAARDRDPRQEIEDLVQEVFLALLEDDAKPLRAWRPDGGRSLSRFVEWFAHHQTESILRSGRRSPWAHEPSDPTLLDESAPEEVTPDVIERTLTSRLTMERLLEGLSERAGAENMRLFFLLFIEERPTAEIMAATGLSRNALYQRRHRLRVLITALLEEMGEVSR